LVKTNLRIMVLENSALFQKLITDALENLGYEATIVSGNVELAMDTLVQAGNKLKSFDLIISDWHMSGQDLFSACKSHPGLKHTPFIALTGQNAKDKIIDAGAKHVLGKPFKNDELSSAIRAACG